MGDSQKIVTQAVRKLLQNTFGEENGETSENYFPVFMRIISSRFGTTNTNDENIVKNILNQKLSKMSEDGQISKASYYKSQELITRICRLKTLNRKGAIFMLLLKLNDSGTSIDFTGNFDSYQIHSQHNISGYSTKTNNEMEIEPIKKPLNKELSSYITVVKAISNKGNSKISLRESDIIRDIIFAFQGIESSTIHYNPNTSTFQLRPSIMITEPTRRLVDELCCIGNHFKKIQTFLSFPSFTLVQQALSYSIKEEINDFLKSLAILESNRMASIDISDRDTLTLRKMYLWVQEPLDSLTWLSIIIDSCLGKQGSHILSVVNSFKYQGSPKIQNLISRIINQLLQSFMKWIYSWMYLGELNDPDKEFFIIENLEDCTSNFWDKKFRIDFDRIPNFLSEESAMKVFVAGKSVIFLKKLCHVKDWIPETTSWAITDLPFDYKQIESLENWILTVSAEANKKLIYVLSTKFQYELHLECLKKFMLMSQGDFFHCLIEMIWGDLSKPAYSVQRHNLTGILESAIRSTNAQFIKTEFLSRLQVKLSHAAQGDLGWDVFSLEYLVEQPISTIIHPESLEKYMKIFHFFWKMKRVHYTLSQIWLQDIKSIQYFERISKMKFDFHNFHLIRHEMLHLLNNLINYLMLEVVEGNWRIMTNELKSATYLDEVIAIHDRFLNRIIDSSLLTGSHNSLKTQLLNIFDSIANFKILNERIMAIANDEFKRKMDEKQKREILKIVEKSKFKGMDEEDSKIDFEKIFLIAPDAKKHLSLIFGEFRDALYKFKRALESEEKLKFLSFKIDFNEFYFFQDPEKKKMLNMEISKNFIFNDTANNSIINGNQSILTNPMNTEKYQFRDIIEIEEENVQNQPKLLPQIFEHENRDDIEEEFLEDDEDSDNENDDSY